MGKTTTKTVNANLNWLKFTLALIVVAVHCKILGGNDTLAGYLLCNGVFRVVVPVFFIINGYFLGQAPMTWPVMRQWLWRVTMLYVFWMVIYSPLYLTGLGFADMLAAIKQWVIGYFHLWYLVGMIGAGALLFVLHQRSTATLAAAALATFAMGVALQYARVYVHIPNDFLQHFNQNDYTARNFLFMAFPFMALGYLLARHPLHLRLSRSLVWGWLLLAMALMLLESELNYRNDPVHLFNFDLLASMPLVAPALFMLVMVYDRPTQSVYVGQMSSAVYFVHPLILWCALGAGVVYGNFMVMLVTLAAVALAPLLIAMNQRWRFML